MRATPSSKRAQFAPISARSRHTAKWTRVGLPRKVPTLVVLEHTWGSWPRECLKTVGFASGARFEPTDYRARRRAGMGTGGA